MANQVRLGIEQTRKATRTSIVRTSDWASIRGTHQGQRPCQPHKKAGHKTAPDLPPSVTKSLQRRSHPHKSLFGACATGGNAPLSTSCTAAWACVFGTLATPEPIKDWSLISLREKLLNSGAKRVSHRRYVAFHMAEVPVVAARACAGHSTSMTDQRAATLPCEWPMVVRSL